MRKWIDGYGCSDPIGPGKLTQAMVVVKVKFTASQQDAHIGVHLSLVQDFVHTVEDLGVPAGR